MIAIALYFAFGCIGIGLFCNLWRLVQGPTIADRILALDNGRLSTQAEALSW
jgi:multicomponent K+:H+ antiporter subunit F